MVIGRGPSGQDISLELAANGAKDVFVATLDYDPNAKLDERDTRVLKPAIDHIAENGDVVFTDGSSISSIDEIMRCTGYLYTVNDFVPKELFFPEGAKSADVAAEHNGVSYEELNELRCGVAAQAFVAPLYKHLFSIEDPTIAFVGLPFSNLPFLCFELQVRWAARVFASSVPLPSQEQMYAEFFELVRELDGNFKYLHKLGAKQKPYFTYDHAVAGVTLVWLRRVLTFCCHSRWMQGAGVAVGRAGRRDHPRDLRGRRVLARQLPVRLPLRRVPSQRRHRQVRAPPDAADAALRARAGVFQLEEGYYSSSCWCYCCELSALPNRDERCAVYFEVNR